MVLIKATGSAEFWDFFSKSAWSERILPLETRTCSSSFRRGANMPTNGAFSHETLTQSEAEIKKNSLKSMHGTVSSLTISKVTVDGSFH